MHCFDITTGLECVVSSSCEGLADIYYGEIFYGVDGEGSGVISVVEISGIAINDVISFYLIHESARNKHCLMISEYKVTIKIEGESSASPILEKTSTTISLTSPGLYPGPLLPSSHTREDGQIRFNVLDNNTYWLLDLVREGVGRDGNVVGRWSFHFD